MTKKKRQAEGGVQKGEDNDDTEEDGKCDEENRREQEQKDGSGEGEGEHEAQEEKGDDDID